MFAGQGSIDTLIGGTSYPINGDLFRFNTKIENVAGLFGGCGSIRELGDNFLGNNKKLRDVHELFRGCGNMVGTAVPLWTNDYAPNIPNDNNYYSLCYSGCTKLTNYNEIPSQWGGGKTVSASEASAVSEINE